MSYFTSMHPRSFFTSSVLCTKMLLDEAGEAVVGDVTLLNDVVRRTVGGKRELVRELRTEGERVAALREVLGVELTEEEREGLSGELSLGGQWGGISRGGPVGARTGCCTLVLAHDGALSDVDAVRMRWRKPPIHPHGGRRLVVVGAWLCGARRSARVAGEGAGLARRCCGEDREARCRLQHVLPARTAMMPRRPVSFPIRPPCSPSPRSHRSRRRSPCWSPPRGTSSPAWPCRIPPARHGLAGADCGTCGRRGKGTSTSGTCAPTRAVVHTPPPRPPRRGSHRADGEQMASCASPRACTASTTRRP